MAREIYKTFVQNSIFYFFSALMANTSLFFVNVTLARVLGQEEYAVIVLLMSVVGMFLMVANLGISDATTKFIAEKTDKKEIGVLITAGLGTLALLSFVSALLMFVLSGTISQLVFKENVVLYIRMGSLWVFFCAMILFCRAVGMGLQRMRFVFLGDFLYNPPKLVYVVVLSAFGITLDRVVFGLTAIAVIGSCVILSYFFSFMKRKEGIPISLKIPSLKTAILKILKYSIFLYLPFLSVYAIYYVLTLQLGMFSSKQNVSYFAVSMSLVTISFLLFMPISKILMPTVSRIYAQRNRDILKTMGKMLTRYIGVTSIFVSSLLCFGSMFFLRLVYGEAYTGAAPVLIVLSLAIFFETFKFITDPLLNGTKYAHAVSHVEVMKLLIVVVSGCILVPRYGALGAASAFLAGSCMSCICKLFMVRRNLDISLFGETMKIFSLFVFLVLFLSFGLSVFAYYAVYCLFVLLFRLVSPGEVRALYRLIAT